MLALIVGTYAFQRLRARRIDLKLSERKKDEKEKAELSDAVQVAGAHEGVGKLMNHRAALPTSLRNGMRSGVDALMVKLRIATKSILEGHLAVYCVGAHAASPHGGHERPPELFILAHSLPCVARGEAAADRGDR